MLKEGIIFFLMFASLRKKVGVRVHYLTCEFKRRERKEN